MSRARYEYELESHDDRASRQIVPHLMELLAPTSVLDVGCGRGSWLGVFAEHGCEVLGLEREEVPLDRLAIPADRIRRLDLEDDVEPPGRFDLALCLEVAEHVSPEAGERLIALLTSSADTVLFSAAVPGQGGHEHVNEQWPPYWQALFRGHGFELDDAIRWRFWDDERVAWWYRQNMVLARHTSERREPVRPVVHPRLLEKKARIIDDFYSGRVPLKTGLIVLARSVLRALRGGSPD